MFEPIDRAARSRPYAAACWLLAALFAAPALGEAIRQPLPYLPPLRALQGFVPFWLLAPVHAAILAAMINVSWRLQRGALVPRLHLGRLLAWFGGGCLSAAFAMIACTVMLAHAPFGFPLCICALLQAVIAGFALTLSLYHQREWWLYP
jgi:hypothetical protein